MARFELYAKIDVLTLGHQYPILICRHGLSDPSVWKGLVLGKQALIVTNEVVAPLYLQAVQERCSAFQCDVLVLKDGEAYKNQQSLFAVYRALIQNKHHRDTTVIALGGGVVGDLAGFAASTYQRGVHLIQVPTTLLAQIDASVGGKTAVNHPKGKNLIGSFYQPQAVLIDVDSLATLPDREFRAGLAEMIKYALLVGGTFLQEVQAALIQGIKPHSPILPQLIQGCCAIKAKFVAADEKEKGDRALLNLGHTFGHALEACTHYQRWLHGEAVAIGLYCAAVLSVRLKHASEALPQQVEEMLEQAGLPHKIPKSFPLDRLREFMRLDKKVKNKNLCFVLIKEPGHCCIDFNTPEESVHYALNRAMEGE